MNKEIKERWIAALRSGEYSQSSGYLSTDEGYCCLGVLCEIALQDQVVIKTKDSSIDEHFVYTSKIDPVDRDTGVLPLAVVAWSGMPNRNPNITSTKEEVSPNIFSEFGNEYNEVTATLAGFNDNGATFEQIADLIEKYL